jgi:hypothetical protein
VAAHGCNTHTQRAAAEAASSRRHGWRHRTLWRQCRNSVPNGQALPGSKAVDRNLSHRGSCRGKPQTPCAGRWREGGLAGFFRNFRGSVGPRGVPRALGLVFRKAHRPNDSDANRIARTMEAALLSESALSVPVPHHPSPFSGRVARAEAIAGRESGGDSLQVSPRPRASRGPSPGGEGWPLQRASDH